MHQKQPKLQLQYNSSMLKNIGMSRPSQFKKKLICSTFMKHKCLPPCVLQHGRHYQIEGAINCHSKNLGDREINFFFGWRFRCLEDEQRPVLVSSQSPPKIRQKLPRTETGITQLPKQVHRSPRWNIKDKRPTYIFCQRAFIEGHWSWSKITDFEVPVKKNLVGQFLLLLKKSCYTTLLII